MTDSPQQPPPSTPPPHKYGINTERLSLASEGFRLWMGKAWKIGGLMAKGAYLLGERRRLLLKLGDEAFSRLKSQDWKAEELDPLVKQLERVTKKIEIEEKLIQAERFGDSPVSAPPPPTPEQNEQALEVKKSEKGSPT